MEREIEKQERESARAAAPDRVPEHPHPLEKPHASRIREAVRDRNRVYQISDEERLALCEIGRFRTVALEDLLKHYYRGEADWMRSELRSLAAQGLIQERTAKMHRQRGFLKVVVLTKAAKRVVEALYPERDQKIYAGFVKPSEVAHDSAIYRMYQAEKERIRNLGGSIDRVVLDYELKRLMYRPLAKAKQELTREEYAKRQAAVAQEHGLKVIGQRIVLPDLRIQYETREGQSIRVDLELATEHYHGSHMVAKAQAGFRFYCADGSANRLSRVLEEREITASILSL